MSGGPRARGAGVRTVDFCNGRTMTAKQQEFVFSRARYPLMYGGVRSGKTTALCWRALRYALKFPGNRGLLARHTLVESKDTLLVDWERAVPRELYTIVRDEGGWEIKIRTSGAPSVILVRPLDRRDRYASWEGGFFGICQADEQFITRDLWDWLTSRLTWKLPDGTTPEYTGFAEANSGAKWIIDLWGPSRTHRMPGYEAVEVSIYDNMRNLPQDTLRDLEQKPAFWKQWYMAACWEPLAAAMVGTPVFQGHFDSALHVPKDSAGNPDQVIPEPGWPIVRGWDVPGPIATVWFQIDRDNRCRVLYEQLADMGEGLRDVKQAVLHISNTLFPGFTFLDVSDPAAIETKSPTDEKTCADVLRPEINLMAGERTLAGRLEAGRSWMDRLVRGRPALAIDWRCRQLVNGLAAGYVWKQVAGRDLPEPSKNSYSHLVDAFLAALARVSQVPVRQMISGRIGPRDFGPPL